MNAAAKSTVKTKPNLTTATPHGAPPEQPAFDTTTPVDVTVVPFTQMDMGKWKPWLISRLQEFWPHVNDMNYLGLMMQISNNTGFILVRTKKAIMLASASRKTLDPRPTVDIIFCFKHHPDDEQEDKDVRILFRHAEKWSKAQGAKHVRIADLERCDSTPSRLKEMLWATESNVLLKDLDK